VIINFLGTELETKELKLLDLIQSLGEYLNSDEGPIRGKSMGSFVAIMSRGADEIIAMSYLADVLQAIPLKVLSVQQSKPFQFISPSKAPVLRDVELRLTRIRKSPVRFRVVQNC
jgi:hypothetical protein